MNRFSNTQFFDGSPLDSQTLELHCKQLFGLEPSQFRVRCSQGYFNTIDVVIWLLANDQNRTFTAETVGARITQLIVLMVGEEIMRKWIGNVQFSCKSNLDIATDPPLQPLNRLPGMVDSFIGNTLRCLPDKPLSADTEEMDVSALVLPEDEEDEREPDGKQMVGTVFELEPPEASEYPAQADLVVASARYGYLWLAMRSDVPFFSCRFSKCHETFCYLKFDGREVAGGTYEGDRATIEEEIDAQLIPNQWGCVVSGGTGRQYSYIDLALSDVPQAVNAIRQVFHDLGITRRSWLLYFDADKQQEWEPMYPDSPPPPLATLSR